MRAYNLPPLEVYSIEGIPFKSLGWKLKVLNISFNSWKVSTKSIASATSGAVASDFFAIHGPMNTTFASLLRALITLPAAIIGETEGERFGIKSL